MTPAKKQPTPEPAVSVAEEPTPATVVGETAPAVEPTPETDAVTTPVVPVEKVNAELSTLVEELTFVLNDTKEQLAIADGVIEYLREQLDSKPAVVTEVKSVGKPDYVPEGSKDYKQRAKATTGDQPKRDYIPAEA